MLALSSLVISSALALLCVTAAWQAKGVPTRVVVSITAVSLVFWLLGLALGLTWYPWTDVVDFVLAVGAGVLVGRAGPVTFTPFLMLLTVLAVLDVVQLVLSPGGPAPGRPVALTAGELYTTFVLRLPWGNYRLGPVDLLLITSIGVYWKRQHAHLLVAFGGVAIGLIVAYAIVAVRPLALPLIPFLLLGWLCSAGWRRRRRVRSDSSATPTPGGPARPPAP